MSKLTKLLESLGEIEQINDSGSIYYIVNDRRIRVSDHIAPTLVMNEFEILTFENSKTNYIVSLYGILHIFHNFTEVKKFILNWCMICKAYDVRQSREGIYKVNKNSRKVVELNNEIKQLELRLKNSQKDIIVIDDFTQGQQRSIKEFIKTNNKNK